MFFCFDDAWLVRGNNNALEFLYGREHSGHGWIEIGDYVYEPTLLLRFQKDIFYQIYSPTNVNKYSKEDYIRKNKDFYEEIKKTTLEDFQPGGRKRIDSIVFIPILQGIAELSDDEDFKKEVSNYLSSIQYDEEQIQTEIQREMKGVFQKK